MKLNSRFLIVPILASLAMSSLSFADDSDNKIPTAPGTAETPAAPPMTSGEAAPASTPAVAPVVSVPVVRHRADKFRLNNVYLEKDALGKELSGIVFLDAISGHFTVPIIGAILGHFESNSCNKLRNTVEKLSKPGIAEFETSKCYDARQPGKDLKKGNVWRFLVPKAMFGFKTKVDLKSAVDSSGVIELTPVRTGNVKDCGGILAKLTEMNVSPDKVEKSQAHDKDKDYTQAAKIQGSCEVADDGSGILKAKLVVIN